MRIETPYPEEQKRITVAGLIFDHENRVLIMKPTFKEGWLLPGGSVERGEYPREAWIRIIKEEIGIPLAPLKLICVDYRKADQESIIMIFSTRVLGPNDELHIALPTEEFSEFRMVSQEEALTLLRPRAVKRFPHAVSAYKTGETAYVEEGDTPIV